jgi:hypothetical protein
MAMNPLTESGKSLSAGITGSAVFVADWLTDVLPDWAKDNVIKNVLLMKSESNTRRTDGKKVDELLPDLVKFVLVKLFFASVEFVLAKLADTEISVIFLV